MVVEAARLLGEAGIAEFSLNFAAYGALAARARDLVERLLAVILRVADRWFQVERLLRFNEKFEPRWQPRYLLFERPLAAAPSRARGDGRRGPAAYVVASAVGASSRSFAVTVVTGSPRPFTSTAGRASTSARRAWAASR